MTPEDQRIAIAEACGWQIKQIKVIGMLDVLLVPPGWPTDAIAYTGDLPNYLHDLNAMHEAEMMCLRSIHKMESYRIVLKEILTRTIAVELDFCACAAHRAEAFLRSIGKWQEEKP